MAKATTNAATINNTTNPYREGSSYHAVVETLRKLGVGKAHSFDAIVKLYPTIIGAEAWKAFKSKEARNDNGKDAAARIVQNVSVVGRRKDYGKPLVDLGWAVLFNGREKEAGLFSIKAVAKATSKPQKAAKAKGKAKAEKKAA